MRSKLLEEVVLKSWWTIAFILLSFFIYDQGVLRKKKELTLLLQKKTTYEQEIEKGLALQKELKKQIASHADPDWIELTLMRNLGLVPEGSKKVHFKS